MDFYFKSYYINDLCQKGSIFWSELTMLILLYTFRSQNFHSRFIEKGYNDIASLVLR